ncbi:hypothetical protein Pyn_20144 [Prunus yedoensis var. nudiflora]|uniref:Uncharacterized protein n=1 Tax=Prunus yedoensis var. nudiflora TaxID=2094558 RepID=A0A314YR16_PRUYE|nr:hypothetical protein Pyn_20144 [Prunus yedoensis var. nudiflora]
MVLLNSLRVVPPKDPLDEDALVQPVLEVIKVFVDVFAMEPSEILIEASIVHGGMLIEAIENMVPNWDLDCGLEEMQLATLAHCLDTWRVYLLDRKFVARTCVLPNHMYCSGNIRDEFSIYLDVLDEFDFELAYMTTRHRDFVEQSDELMIDGAQSDSFASNPSESESEGEPWESSAIDRILRNAMFGKRNESFEVKEEPRVESMAGIIVISNDDEEEPMEEPMEVILIDSSDDESMEESNGEVVRANSSDAQKNEDRQGVEPTRASGSSGGGGKPKVHGRCTREARQCRKTSVLGSYVGAQRARRMRNARRQIMGSSWQVIGNVLEWVYDMAKRKVENFPIYVCVRVFLREASLTCESVGVTCSATCTLKPRRFRGEEKVDLGGV